uniref:Uncharacterized protein n=1 Tax=Strix occidentalis caurina TaxID=311401 RepID=A0A8D0F8J8_STROC
MAGLGELTSATCSPRGRSLGTAPLPGVSACPVPAGIAAASPPAQPPARCLPAPLPPRQPRATAVPGW